MKSRQIATELSAEFNQTRDPKRRRELIRLKLMALGADFKMLAPFIKLASPVDIRTLLSKLRAKHSELKDNRLYGDIISFYGERDLSVYLKQLSGAERLFLNEGLIYRLEDNPTALRRVEALRADLAKDFLAEKSAQSGKLLLLSFGLQLEELAERLGMLYEKFSKAVRPKLIAETEFLGDVDFMAALKDWYQRQKDAGKDLAQLGLPDEAQKILENIKATNLERTLRRRSCARAIRDVGAASGEIQN